MTCSQAFGHNNRKAYQDTVTLEATAFTRLPYYILAYGGLTVDLNSNNWAARALFCSAGAKMQWLCMPQHMSMYTRYALDSYSEYLTPVSLYSTLVFQCYSYACGAILSPSNALAQWPKIILAPVLLCNIWIIWLLLTQSSCSLANQPWGTLSS